MDAQTLVLLYSWLRAHPALAASCALAWLIAQWWVAQPHAWRADLVKRHPRLTLPVEFLNTIGPNIISLGRMLYWRGVRGVGERAPTTVEAPQPVDMSDMGEGDRASFEDTARQRRMGGSDGFADLSALRIVAALALFVLASALALSCRGMPAPDGCTPLSVRCSPEGVPQACDTQARWTPVDDQCSRNGYECIVTAAYSSRLLSLCLTPAQAAEARANNNEVVDAGR